MKTMFLAGILFTCGTVSLDAQQTPAPDACKFTVSDTTTQATITGAEDIVKLVRVMAQPDSPLEILAVDFKPEGFLAISNEQFAEQLRCTARVRNRSDRTIHQATISLTLGDTRGSVGTEGGIKMLPPGQESEFNLCGGGGGSGGAKGNNVRIVVVVRDIDFGSCTYRVSQRIPKDLGVRVPGTNRRSLW